jgi:hypothetical protein
MTWISNSTGAASHGEEGRAAAPGIADWLHLAAAPTFAVMALMTAVPGEGRMDVVCSAGHGSPLSGMVPMYLLMSAFHSAPWIRLIPSRRQDGRRSDRARRTTFGNALAIWSRNARAEGGRPCQ